MLDIPPFSNYAVTYRYRTQNGQVGTCFLTISKRYMNSVLQYLANNLPDNAFEIQITENQIKD